MKGTLTMRTLLATALVIGLTGAPAFAQDKPPPQGAKPLSALLQTIEKSADFRNFDDIEWEHGVYEVKYYTKAGAKMTVRIDPVSGNPVPAGTVGGSK
jgi:hypothetical protein